MPKKKSQKVKLLNSHNLKQILWETLLEVRSGKMDTTTANAIAQSSKEIMNVVNTEIKIAGMGLEKFRNFVEAPVLAERKKKS